VGNNRKTRYIEETADDNKCSKEESVIKINEEKCVGCELCIPYCTVGAISMSDGVAKINQDDCVECGVCIRSGICPVDAFEETPSTWPRSLRAILSDPLIESPDTRVPGRGTEEVKTNDVSGRAKPGFVGFAVEMGRPGVSTSMHDVQKMTMALAPLGVDFEAENPVTFWITDKKTGKLRDDVLNEKSLSAIIEFGIPIGKLPSVIEVLRKMEKEVDTVFSCCVASKVLPDGSIPAEKILKDMGITVRPNCKTNVGLGRPRFEFTY
jgi:ferredoxin